MVAMMGSQGAACPLEGFLVLAERTRDIKERPPARPTVAFRFSPDGKGSLPSSLA